MYLSDCKEKTGDKTIKISNRIRTEPQLQWGEDHRGYESLACSAFKETCPGNENMAPIKSKKIKLKSRNEIQPFGF